MHKSYSTSNFPKSTMSSQFTVNEWMQAIRSPTPYRVGNARLHMKPRMLAYCALLASAVLILLVYFIPSSSSSRIGLNCNYRNNRIDLNYDDTYPLTEPVKTALGTQFRIAVVTDLDTDSKSKDKSSTWVSFLKYGNLTISDNYSKVVINFDKTVTLSSKRAEGDRGMELSELIVFNGKLLTVDDRTGIVYEITNNKVIPWVILTDGNGKEEKGKKMNGSWIHRNTQLTEIHFIQVWNFVIMN